MHRQPGELGKFGQADVFAKVLVTVFAQLPEPGSNNNFTLGGAALRLANRVQYAEEIAELSQKELAASAFGRAG
jgi:hypothetical protein